MNSSRDSRVRRSKSPKLMSKRTRSNNKSNINNIVIKKKAKLRPVHKSSSKLNTSKGSKTGLSNLSVSRSVPSLPIIAGNDLKTIKEIFTRAKKFKEKYGRQKIPVKVMMAGKYSSMGHLRVSRSIPKYRKFRHSTVGNSSKIKKPNKEHIHKLKLSADKNDIECSKDQDDSLTEVQEIPPTKYRSGPKNSTKSKNKSTRKNAQKYQTKYGIEVRRNANGFPATTLVHRKMISKRYKNINGSTKDDRSEMTSLASGIP
ncbi:unnamed protein product [Moneuplotes crassus]|uniref:Uncharacterized protein n=1 Tax=Euplotes crassus TaxID=5936 RepID=A0AAD1UUS2_EUPCR|nr:unnamed protein product [Moneuplotes crassus]